MLDPLARLAKTVSSRLSAFRTPPVRPAVIKRLLTVAYQASMRTEEGRFVRGSLTYADPSRPDLHPPITRRNDYPQFTRFRSSVPLTEITLVKLARAVDSWSASLAVWTDARKALVAWGLVDQLVETNVLLNREGRSGFSLPGVFTITIDAVGEVSVYHGHILLGRLRSHEVIDRETDALQASQVLAHVRPHFAPIADSIARHVGLEKRAGDVSRTLLAGWGDTIARVCIGLRRIGSGGALVLTPAPVLPSLHLGYEVPYSRLGDALALLALDEWHLGALLRQRWARARATTLPAELITDLDLAEADYEDRESELSSAVKVATSFASADGAVLMTPTLGIRAFGVKIGPGPAVSTVYDGPCFARLRTRAPKIDLRRFGTRHTSVLRYCRRDPSAIGVVVSQDGHVRVVASEANSLTMWEDVKLLGHYHFSLRNAALERQADRARDKARGTSSLGFSHMPKTMTELRS